MDNEKDEVKQEQAPPGPEEQTEPVPQTEEKEKPKKKGKKLDDALEKLSAEFETYKEQHLRVLAEYDNFRKRTQSEKAAIYNNAVSDTIQAILPVADNIQLALGQENASVEDLKKGVEMIETQIEAVFQKLGITETGKVGETFDPQFHNAVAHIEDENLGENTISAVYQKGYLLGDRVVRHAMVQVAN